MNTRVNARAKGDSTPRDRTSTQSTGQRPLSADEDPVVELRGLGKRFTDEEAVKDISLTVEDGELLTLLGPSGCGKTTTLRLIAGLERPTSGTIRLDGESVARADDSTFHRPETRDVGVVFQGFALFPHLTAEENVAFGIESLSDCERNRRVDELFELVDLVEYRDSYPAELSGGQQQRVALARSLAPDPDVLLLDEPFSNLDVALRTRVREKVRRILKETDTTAISVTHDQEEALSISDRIAVMHDGRIKQVDRPDALFHRPKSRFVAEFLGQANFVSAYVSGASVRTPLGKIDREQLYGLDSVYDETQVDVLVRPDDVVAVSAGPTTRNGTVTYRRYQGSTVVYRVELENGDVVACLHNHADPLELGSDVRVKLVADHGLAWFPAE